MNTFESLGIDLKGRTKGTTKTRCPKCSHTRKHKNEPCLSVNIDKGVFHCHNADCNYKGSLSGERVKDVYDKPDFKYNPLSEKTIAWFIKRGISEDVLRQMKISESEEFMPQVSKKMNCICFNYYRNNELVNVKYRDGAKDFKMVKNAELIFYNLDCIKEMEYCTITEGEMDCLSFIECGKFATISVPNGATRATNNLKYLDNCLEYFENKTKIILATDNDNAGLMLREELARRLGKERCWTINYPEGCKDANEVLMKCGADVLVKIYDEAQPMPVDGILDFDPLQEQVIDFYKNVYGSLHSVGFGEFDKLIKFSDRELTVVTGIPSHGKTLYIFNLMVRLSAKYNWKWGVYAGESVPTSLAVIDLVQIYTGYNFWGNGKDKCPESYLTLALKFVREHFYFFDLKSEELSADSILNSAKELVKRFGIRGLLIDNWSSIEHVIPYGLNETQYVSRFMNKLRRFRGEYSVNVILVAHPRKMSKNEGTGLYNTPTLYDISGSAHFFNLTDNGICVYRDMSDNSTMVYVQKVRNSFVGELGNVRFKFELTTKRFSEDNLPFEKMITENYKFDISTGEIIEKNNNLPF
jgi:twinkle protein